MIIKTTLIGLVMSFSIAAQAEVALTKADVVGKWSVDAEALSADQKKGMKALNSTWTFREDGTMEGYSSDNNKHARVAEFRANVQYSIEDGKMKKQASPGRSKFDLCVAVDLTPPKMTLECNHIFYFMTKE